MTTQYAIERWDAGRWKTTGFIKPDDKAETDQVLAEERLAEAEGRNPGAVFRIVSVKVRGGDSW